MSRAEEGCADVPVAGTKTIVGSGSRASAKVCPLAGIRSVGVRVQLKEGLRSAANTVPCLEDQDRFSSLLECLSFCEASVSRADNNTFLCVRR